MVKALRLHIIPGRYIMDVIKLLAAISRDFLNDKKVIRYRLKKIEDLSDQDVIRVCHWYCEENHLTKEFDSYRQKVESQYRDCPYLQEFIDDEQCYNVQLIANGSIKASALPECPIDIKKASSFCYECKYKMK